MLFFYLISCLQWDFDQFQLSAKAISGDTPKQTMSLDKETIPSVNIFHGRTETGSAGSCAMVCKPSPKLKVSPLPGNHLQHREVCHGLAACQAQSDCLWLSVPFTICSLVPAVSKGLGGNSFVNCCGKTFPSVPVFPVKKKFF